jgi:hypothetical protein
MCLCNLFRLQPNQSHDWGGWEHLLHLGKLRPGVVMAAWRDECPENLVGLLAADEVLGECEVAHRLGASAADPAATVIPDGSRWMGLPTG